MKLFEQATSYPYGHLLIDLKSDTPEKDRLHTEIFKTINQKVTVDEGSMDTIDNEKDEKEGEK